MQVQAQIRLSDNSVSAPGGGVFSPVINLGDTLILSLAFEQDDKAIIPLANGATGQLVIVQTEGSDELARAQINSWTASGTGAKRRYTFRGKIDSAALRADLTDVSSADYTLQIFFQQGGTAFVARSVPCTILRTRALNSVPPPVPTTSYIRPWQREIYGPTEAIAAETLYAGHIDRGGPIHSLRVSVTEYAPGATVMLKHNGTNIFTAPLEITSKTMLIETDDAILALTALTSAAEILAATTPADDGYDGCKGLQVEFGIQVDEVSQAVDDPTAAYEWLKAALPDLDWDDEAEEGTLVGTPTSSGFSIVDGALRFTIGGTEYMVPAFPV